MLSRLAYLRVGQDRHGDVLYRGHATDGTVVLLLPVHTRPGEYALFFAHDDDDVLDERADLARARRLAADDGSTADGEWRKFVEHPAPAPLARGGGGA